MAKATWNGVVIAEGDDFLVVEGNVYFAPSAVNEAYLRANETRSVCGWKGDCAYFDVVVGDAVNRDAAWVYRDPKPAAADVRGRIAFWHGVRVER